MSLSRASLLLALLGGASAVAPLVACGGDDAPGAVADGGTTPPSSSSGALPPPDAGPPPPNSGPTFTISDTTAKVYLGQTARLDGAAIAPGVTGLTWTVVFASSGSSLTTASLQDAATATPSFTPDVLGAFTLQGVGTKNGVAATVLVFVEAVDTPIFYRETRVQVNGAVDRTESEMKVGGLHGSAPRAVACAPIVADAGSSALQFAIVGARIGASAGDTWEAPAGFPSRVVFPELRFAVATQSFQTRTTVASSESTCATDVAIEQVDLDAGVAVSPTVVVQNARFSHDGARVAYLHSVGGSPRISTAGFGGDDPRMLSAFQSLGRNDGGLDPDAGFAPNAGPFGPATQMGLRWLDGTHVGWVTFVGAEGETSSNEWELYTVQDAPGAAAALHMHCSNSRMYGFDFLPDGSVLAAARTPAVVVVGEGEAAEQQSGPMNLVVYRPNATTKECEIVRSLTQNTAPDSVARDLALSPDKTTVAFFSGVGSGDAISGDNVAALYTVPVDGSRAAAPLPGAEGPVDLGIGPRWVSGASSITWGQLLQPASGGLPVGRLMAIPAIGGVARIVAEGSATLPANNGEASPQSIRLVYGVGQGCSMTGGLAPLSAFGAVAGLGMVALLARRRRARR